MRLPSASIPESSRINGQPVKLMGYSMRTPEYRITRWIDRDTGETMDTEIYDHTGTDPEMINLAPRSGVPGAARKIEQGTRRALCKRARKSIK